MKTKEKIKWTLKKSTAQIVWCNFNQRWLKVFDITFLSKYADRKFEIPDKSIVGDPNQPHFWLALS